jgi:hypothetical protein
VSKKHHPALGAHKAQKKKQNKKLLQAQSNASGCVVSYVLFDYFLHLVT